MGYGIDASPKSGYSFVKITNLLLPEEIGLSLETHSIGKQILHHRELTSTQDTAEELARNGADEGTVVIAETQTRGRGRKGRNWVSPSEGGLYLSIILRPGLIPSQVIQIPLIAGMAVCRAIIKETALQPGIKWPNDVMIGGRKVAGILTEISSELDRVNYVVLGIGVNINTPGSRLAGPTGGIGTSLFEEGRKSVPRVVFVQQLLYEFEALYTKFLASGFGPIRAEWKTLDSTIGSRVKVGDGGEEIEGKAIDIDEDGFLLVRQETGDIKRIVSGDVFLTPHGA